MDTWTEWYGHGSESSSGKPWVLAANLKKKKKLPNTVIFKVHPSMMTAIPDDIHGSTHPNSVLFFFPSVILFVPLLPGDSNGGEHLGSMNSIVKAWKLPGKQFKCRQCHFSYVIKLCSSSLFRKSCMYLCSVSGDNRSGGPSWLQSWLTFVFEWLLPRQSSSVRICPLTADSLRSVLTQQRCF